MTGSSIPFNRNGSSSVLSKVLRQRSSTSAGRQHLARLGLRHQPCGESGGLAQDGVGLAERRADLAREDAPPARAHAQRQPAGPGRDPEQRAQQPLLVLALRLRRAGDEDHLGAVGVDVGLEEGDAVLLGRPLRCHDELLENGRRLLRPGAGEQRVDAPEVDEADGRLAVLRLALASLEMAANRLRHAWADVHVFEGRQRRDLAADRRRRLEEATPCLRRAEELSRQRRRRLFADEDLARLRAAFHLDGARDARAADEQLAVRLADEEEVVRVAVDADVHPQRHGTGGGLERTEVGEARASCRRRRRTARPA